jgi:hypothetical protein
MSNADWEQRMFAKKATRVATSIATNVRADWQEMVEPYVGDHWMKKGFTS